MNIEYMDIDSSCTHDFIDDALVGVEVESKARVAIFHINTTIPFTQKDDTRTTSR